MKILNVIIASSILFLTACGSSDGTTSSNDPQKNYEHYSGGDFDTMQSCLSFIQQEADTAGMSLAISSDKPDKVTGSFNGDADMFFYCQKKETGTNGTFFEAAYPKFN